MICKLVGISTSFLIVSILAYAWYSGVFTPVNIETLERGPFRIVTLPHLGPYRDTGPLFEVVDKFLRSADIQSSLCVGVYLDDPAEVGEPNCRAVVGCAVDSDEQWEKLNAMGLDDYFLVTVPKRDALVVKWPMKNMFGMLAGIFRVYPALHRYTRPEEPDAAPKFDWRASLEVYDMQAETMEFVIIGDYDAESLWTEAKVLLD